MPDFNINMSIIYRILLSMYATWEFQNPLALFFSFWFMVDGQFCHPLPLSIIKNRNRTAVSAVGAIENLVNNENKTRGGPGQANVNAGGAERFIDDAESI